MERTPLIEWLASNYKTFGSLMYYLPSLEDFFKLFFLVFFELPLTAGTSLEIITDKSQEGSQFCRGFGGIGGLLRYRVDFQAMDIPDMDVEGDMDDYL